MTIGSSFPVFKNVKIPDFYVKLATLLLLSRGTSSALICFQSCRCDSQKASGLRRSSFAKQLTIN